MGGNVHVNEIMFFLVFWSHVWNIYKRQMKPKISKCFLMFFSKIFDFKNFILTIHTFTDHFHIITGLQISIEDPLSLTWISVLLHIMRKKVFSKSNILLIKPVLFFWTFPIHESCWERFLLLHLKNFWHKIFKNLQSFKFCLIFTKGFF